MSIIEKLGQSQYYLTFDEEYRQRLFAVQGEIGRTFVFTLLDKDRKPILNATGSNTLQMIFLIQTQHGNSIPVSANIDNASKFAMKIPQRALYYSGYCTYQLSLNEIGSNGKIIRILGSKQATMYIEPNINFTAPDGENFFFSFMEFTAKMNLIDALITDQDNILQEQIQARDEMLEIYNQIDLANDVIDKIAYADELKAKLDVMFNNSTLSIIHNRLNGLDDDVRALEKKSASFTSDLTTLKNQTVVVHYLPRTVANSNTFSSTNRFKYVKHFISSSELVGAEDMIAVVAGIADEGGTTPMATYNRFRVTVKGQQFTTGGLSIDLLFEYLNDDPASGTTSSPSSFNVDFTILTGGKQLSV